MVKDHTWVHKAKLQSTRSNVAVWTEISFIHHQH